MNRNIPSSVDRISGLPDPLLCHILSFLPTKLSVATSILSRRWRLLWTQVPVLKFDIGDYDKYDRIRNDDWDHASYFANIVDKVLLLYSVENLITFRLNTSFDYYVDSLDDEQIERWLTNVIARKVQKLDLCLELYLDYMVLPQSVFTCKTLVDLRLHSVEVLLPEAVCFPNLKRLDLIEVRYDIFEPLPQLISGCPVLEKLVINTIIYGEEMLLSISSPTIKWLELQLTMDGHEFYDDDVYRVEINLPALRYLRSVDWIYKHISTHTLTSLIEADVIFIKEPYGEDNNVGYYGNVLECIDKLCNVKYLKLSLPYSKFLDSDFSASTVRFNNLTRLQLSADVRFISKFLKNADNLQVLIFNQGSDNLCWMEPQQVPTCLSSHLTTIKIYSFNYAEHEFKMVRYLLMNAQVLKRMEISSLISDYKKKFHGLKRISEFPRGSTACELYFN